MPSARTLTALTVALALTTFTALTASAAGVNTARRADGGRTIQLGGHTADTAYMALVGPSGDLFVAVVSESADFIRPAKFSETAPIVRNAALMRVSPSGRVRWRRILTPEAGYGRVSQLVYDAARDRLVVAGVVRPTTGPGFQMSMFVTAFTRDGEQQWRRVFDHTDSRADNVDVNGLAIGPKGGLHVVGSTRGDMAGQAHIGQAYNDHSNGWDVFVVKLTPDGVLDGARLFGVGDPDPDRVFTQYNDYGQAIAVDPRGRVFVAGRADGDLLKHRHMKGTRHFWMVLDARLEYPKVSYAKDKETPDWRALAADEAGHIYRVGVGDGDLGGTDLCLEKLDPKGRVIWKHEFGTAARDYPVGLGLGPKGRIYVGATKGLFSKTSDALLYAFKANGDLVGERVISTPQREDAEGLGVTRYGVALAGGTTGALDGNANHRGRGKQDSRSDGFVTWFTATR